MVAPTITINGRDISPRFVRSAKHVGRARVRIEWGRETLFDRPVPGVATVTIINRGIDTPTHRKGDSIMIAYPSFGTLYRGTIAETTTTTDYVTHANGLREKITETVITAHDPVANLSQFIPVGPADALGANSYPGEGGWYLNPNNTRIAEIMNAGASRFIDSHLAPSSTVQSTPTTVLSWAAARKPDDVTALDLLYEAYSMAGPLTAFYYDPTLHRLGTARHQPATHAVVTLAGAAAGALTIALATGVTALPAELAEIDSTTLDAPAEDVAVARLESLRLDLAGGVYTYVDAAASIDVPGASSGRTFTAPGRSMMFLNPSGTQQAQVNAYRAWWLAAAAATFGAINGTKAIPPLTIDPENPIVQGSGQSFHTYHRAQSFYLNGSMFNGEEGAPSVVQVVGGVLEYDDGKWSHTLTVAPTAGGAPPTLTLDQMFPTSSTDRLDAWDENLTINDLAAVTRRT
ncbi:hypothetical protein AUC47_04880 [Microbacterium sp. SZ1]|uniref:hypothetical protein n=1 Tax=Microbacterium sp. SZ1 TaxID=1849736 RepID=UPI000BBBB83B|nr:hypothetical protein [Microbacterium sp. SZ1]PCE13985.1 hypothetical protein AUC47_04880 [Microbacterium sp. SZ1]